MDKENVVVAVQPMDGMDRRDVLVAGGGQLCIYRLHLFDEHGILANFDWLTEDTGRYRADVAILLPGPIVEMDGVRYNAAPLFFVRHAAQIEGMAYVDVYIHEQLLPVERIAATAVGSGKDRRLRYMYRVRGTGACFVTWDAGLEQLRSARMEQDAQALAAQCTDVADSVQGRRDAWL